VFQGPPFLARMKQPWRGLIQWPIMGVVTVLLMLIFVQWWQPWGPPDAAAGDFGSVLTFSLWLVGCFGWFAWFAFHAGNWPFHKLGQPLQGICAIAASTVGFTLAFLFFYNYLGWGDQLFSLMICWYFWTLVFSTLSGLPLLNAYKGKQPLTAIVGFCLTWAAALVTWYALPAAGTGEFFQGTAFGFPFPWFLIAVITFWIIQLWPMGNIKQPLHLIIHLGLWTFWMLVLLVILRAFGLNYWEPVTGAHYLEAGVWVAISINVGIWITTTFQMWPFHRLPFAGRAVLWVFLIVLITQLIFKFAVSGTAPPAATLAADPAAWFAHTEHTFYALAWNMAAFYGWLGWNFNTYACFLPPPEGTTPPPPIPPED